MEIIIRNNFVYKDVTVVADNVKIDLGLLDEEEIRYLIRTLTDAIQELL